MEGTCVLTVAYDGAAYAGFARQPDQTTIQGELEDALHVALRYEIQTVCAGRTDAGVHALGQQVSFPLDISLLKGATSKSFVVPSTHLPQMTSRYPRFVWKMWVSRHASMPNHANIAIASHLAPRRRCFCAGMPGGIRPLRSMSPR